MWFRFDFWIQSPFFSSSPPQSIWYLWGRIWRNALMIWFGAHVEDEISAEGWLHWDPNRVKVESLFPWFAGIFKRKENGSLICVSEIGKRYDGNSKLMIFWGFCKALVVEIKGIRFCKLGFRSVVCYKAYRFHQRLCVLFSGPVLARSDSSRLLYCCPFSFLFCSSRVGVWNPRG